MGVSLSPLSIGFVTPLPLGKMAKREAGKCVSPFFAPLERMRLLITLHNASSRLSTLARFT